MVNVVARHKGLGRLLSHESFPKRQATPLRHPLCDGGLGGSFDKQSPNCDYYIAHQPFPRAGHTEDKEFTVPVSISDTVNSLSSA